MRLVGNHKHCVQLLDTFVGRSRFYLVMERCDAQLLHHIDKMYSAGEACMADLFHGMLLGIAHVHRHNVVHCDIKPSNFMISYKDGATVKLLDFGFALRVPSKGSLTSHRGSAPYMPPEMCAHKSYDTRTDIWSMGVTAYVLLYGTHPYYPKPYNSEAMKQMIVQGKPAPAFINVMANNPHRSRPAKCFVQTLMERDQRRRISALKALRLSFVASKDFDSTKSDTESTRSPAPSDVHTDCSDDSAHMRRQCAV